MHRKKQAEPFEYPNAGKHAPDKVKEAVEEFRNTPLNKYKKNRPLLYHILGTGTPDYKMSKSDSDYTNKSPYNSKCCANCASLYLRILNKHLICSQIQGNIKKSGWCKLWNQGK